MQLSQTSEGSVSRQVREPGNVLTIDDENVIVLAQHEVEHLSTLVTAANRAPPDAYSSIKRLRSLQDTGQLHTTKVQLIFQRSDEHAQLVVADLINEEVCERFRLEDILSPIYKESNDTTDEYNNLLMFNINANPNSKNGPKQHEMHIFQCCNIPAHVLVDELLEFRCRPQSNFHRQKPVKSSTTHEEKEFVKEQPVCCRHSNTIIKSEFIPHVLEIEDPNTPVSKGFLEETLSPSIPDEEEELAVVTVGNDADNHVLLEQQQKKAYIDAEILLLNLCFDDIESYVGNIVRIQRSLSVNSLARSVVDDNVSISAKEKKKKRKGFRFKKRTSNRGSGVDNSISRPMSNTSGTSEIEIQISNEEVKDMFEKVKFAILILSRIQGFVSEPNPPLLTHRLFSILRQPIEFVRDPVTGKPELARRVVTPLFTEATIRLIEDSLIEPELSLWQELGDSWCVPREQWPDKEVPSYIPVFKCGFKPDPDSYHFSLFHMDEVPQSFPSKFDNTYDKPSFLTSAMKGIKTNAEYRNVLVESNSKIAKARKHFRAANSKELTLKAGEYVEVLDDAGKWFKLRNRQGNVGYAPFTVLEYNVFIK